jgi:hypothetical protein
MVYYIGRYRASLCQEIGIQHNNFLLASRLATENVDDEVDCRDHCALLFDEMMITNGIVYNVSQQKKIGLSDTKPHEIESEIYQDFYGMKTDSNKEDNLNRVSYFTDTANKLPGHTATGLTQVT